MNIKQKPKLLLHERIHSFPSNNVVTEPRFLAVAALTKLLIVKATFGTQLIPVMVDDDTEVKHAAQTAVEGVGNKVCQVFCMVFNFTD